MARTSHTRTVLSFEPDSTQDGRPAAVLRSDTKSSCPTSSAVRAPVPLAQSLIKMQPTVPAAVTATWEGAV